MVTIYKRLFIFVCFFALPSLAEEIKPDSQNPALIALSQQISQKQIEKQNNITTLSLEEALETAISNNLEAQIQQDDVEIADLNFKISRGVYAPKIGFESYYENQIIPVTNAIAGGQAGFVKTESWVGNSYLSGISAFGTDYKLFFDNSRTRTSNFFQLLVPEYRSTLGLNITQPLLKNFWINENRKNIKILKLNKNLSSAQFTQKMQEVVYKTEASYWDLLLASKTIEINQEAVWLAEEQLHRTKRLGEIGETPKIDSVSAEVELEKRKEELAIAQEKLLRAENDLKVLISNGFNSGFWEKTLTINQELAQTPNNLNDLQAALALAFEKRPEFSQIENRFKAKQIERNYLINQGLPQMDLVGQYSMEGLAGSVRQNPRSTSFGNTTVLPRFTGDYSDDMQNVFSNDFRTARIGLNFSWPIAPGTTKKVLKKNDLEKHQIELEAENTKQLITAEVLNAFNAIKTSEQRIQASQASLKAAERQLEAENQKFKIGITTNFMVITRQNDLSAAKLRVVNAITDYNKSINSLRKAVGIILEEKNIKVISQNP